MKLPRDINGTDLANKLDRLGFTILRQKGSHIVVRHEDTSETIAIPAHRPLKVGTLAAILSSVAELTGRSRAEVLTNIQS